MGLSVTLANALAGMDLSQRGLTIVSRNVANAGTPGYHRQSLQRAEDMGVNSVSVRAAKVQRAYLASLDTQTYRETSKMGEVNIRADFMNQVDQLLGKPGGINSLDTQLANLKSSLQMLTTSPEDFVARSQVVDRAQSMAETLNFLSHSTQAMRSETESQMMVNVAELNQHLNSLESLNQDLMDTTQNDETRIGLLDERDRMILRVSEMVDLTVQYRDDGSIALHTRSGVGLLDRKASQFEFESAGNLSANAIYDRDDTKSGVGELSLISASGLKMDVVEYGILQGGKLQGLLDLRDKTLVNLQDQLDEVAASIAQVMNTVQTDGTAVSSGGADGYEVDVGAMQAGNFFSIKYEEGGVSKKVNVVRVDDLTKLPMDETSSDGVRTIGLDFSGGIGAVAASLNASLGAAITVSNPAGNTIRIMDDGAGNTTNINELKSFHTVAADQGAGSALSLFVDNGGKAFTNSLDGTSPQKRGFASRIVLNQNIVADTTLLIKYDTGTSIGDATRPNLLVDQFNSMQFVANTGSDLHGGKLRIAGSVDNVLQQVLNYQGNLVSASNQAQSSQKVVMDTLELRAEAEYGVDIDQEMAMLLELQNAYAANARIVSIAKELVDTLMQI